MSAKQFPQTLALQRQLIQQLADGKTHSGEALAQQAGISRAAIAKHIKQLNQIGLDVFAIAGKGYRLAQPLNLLNINQIKQQQNPGMPEVLLQHLTDSTNTQLLKKLQDGQQLQKGQVIVAEAQSAGRGRRGNDWYSPFGSNLYFSMYWQLEQGIQAAMGLSLVVGIAIARLLDRLYQCQINLKWPNDLYAEHKKLGGILVELTGQTHAQCDVVIGVGLNIQMPADSNAKISQAFTDLASVSGQSIERNQLVSQLQFELIQTLQSFENKGFVAFADEFNRRDEFAGQRVQLSGGNAPTIGICQGVDQYGGLVVRQADGLKSFYSGELSLRKHGD
jgi:BirA family biotin operon repressor/biotin-[acetyl-CoA-carboxylase] ligase